MQDDIIDRFTNSPINQLKMRNTRCKDRRNRQAGRLSYGWDTGLIIEFIFCKMVDFTRWTFCRASFLVGA